MWERARILEHPQNIPASPQTLEGGSIMTCVLKMGKPPPRLVLHGQEAGRMARGVQVLDSRGRVPRALQLAVLR